MRDESEKGAAIYGRVVEADILPVTVGVEATAADLHHRAVQASRRQRGGADLPGDRGGMLQRVVEAVGGHMQVSVGSSRIRRTQRVQLLDGAVSVDYHKSARQQP